MSVIVNDMRLPDCCGSCKLSNPEDEGLYCTPLEKLMWFWLDEVPDGRLPKCPLVELIRCKDCKHSKPIDSEWLECQHDKRVMKPSGFCSWAEPKETE